MGTPDKGVPDGPLPDVAQPDASLPDAPTKQLDICPCPDVTVPDKLVPDFPVPDMPVPDQKQPDLMQPDLMQPDLMQPDLMQPDIKPANPVLDPNGWQYTKVSQVHSTYYWPSAASNKHKTTPTSLVAWKETGGKVHAALINASGKPALSTDIKVYTNTSAQVSPSVASDGTGYLVVWDTNSKLMGRLVDSAGAASGAAFEINSKNPQSPPVVAFDGTAYLVVWAGLRSTTNKDISARRVSTTGKLLGTSSTKITTPMANTNPRLACDGSTCLVAWHELIGGSNYEVHARAISAAGTVLGGGDTPLVTQAKNQIHPTVASGTSDYLVAWEDYRLKSFPEIYGARFKVSTAGVITRVDTKDIYFSGTDSHDARPAAAHDGKHYMVAWSDRPASTSNDYGIFGARLLGSGTVLDKPPIVISNPAKAQRGVSLAFDGTNYLAVWMDRRTNSRMIFGARIKP